VRVTLSSTILHHLCQDSTKLQLFRCKVVIEVQGLYLLKATALRNCCL